MRVSAFESLDISASNDVPTVTFEQKFTDLAKFGFDARNVNIKLLGWVTVGQRVEISAISADTWNFGGTQISQFLFKSDCWHVVGCAKV